MSKITSNALVKRIVSGGLAVTLILWVLCAIMGVLSEDEATKGIYGTVSTVALIAAVVFAVLCIILNWNAVREALRKGVVSLKRSPQTIPLLMGVITFLYFSLNLTVVSNTTAKIQASGMGLCEFCIMLFSLLSLVCMMNAFPHRKKTNIPMLILMYVMFAVIIYCDIHYTDCIYAAVRRPENPIVITEDTKYLSDAYNMLNTHMILMIVNAVLVALLPVYSKLIRKINTSVNIEDNGEMAEIEITE